MSISQIIALVRDAVILAALAFVVWGIYHAGKNADLADDMKAVQKQLDANSRQIAAWSKESQDAETQRQADMARVSADIRARNAPVIVRIPASGSSLPGTPGTPPSGTACPGGSAAGPGSDIDIRQAINGFEEKYESALASCRSVLASWPK